MAPSAKRPAPVFNELEMEAIRGLVELRFLRKRQGFLESLSFACLPFPWGAQRPRTISNSVGGEPRNSEETEKTVKVSEKTSPRKSVRKFKRLKRLPQSEIVARAVKAEPVLKAPPPSEGIASPTSPLLNGIISLSSHGEPSDSNNSQRISPPFPPEHPKIQFKVETKAEVQSSPKSRGHKKKAIAELKQRLNEQSLLKEKLEKEMKMQVVYHELLMDENKSLKEQLVLKFEGKEQNKLFLCTFDSSQQTMLSHSRDNHSSSHRDFLPDLNIPLEEPSHNNFGDFDNQLLKTDKFVAAAQARKYRAEYLRYKQSCSSKQTSSLQQTKQEILEQST